MVVISQQLAEDYFEGENPIGKHLSIVRYKEPLKFRIVGVSRQVREVPGFMNVGIGSRYRKNLLYYSSKQMEAGNFWARPVLVLQLEEKASISDEKLQKMISTIDPGFVAKSFSIEAANELATLPQRLPMKVGLIFSVFAVALTFLGLFSYVAVLVAEQSRENWIKMVMGASVTRIVRGVLVEIGPVVVIATMLGLAVSYGLSHKLDSFFKEIDATHFSGFLIVFLAVQLTCAMAALIPTVRAVREI